MIELLPVRTEIPTLATMDGTIYYPFDRRVYDLIKWVFTENGINTAGLFDDIKTMRKNKNEIVRLANQLIEKLKEEEKYWIENMPFFTCE